MIQIQPIGRDRYHYCWLPPSLPTSTNFIRSLKPPMTERFSAPLADRSSKFFEYFAGSSTAAADKSSMLKGFIVFNLNMTRSGGPAADPYSRAPTIPELVFASSGFEMDHVSKNATYRELPVFGTLMRMSSTVDSKTLFPDRRLK